MATKLNKYVEELSWDEIRQQVKIHNPELARIIDDLPLTKEHSIIKIDYPYGIKILNNGILQFPINDEEYEDYTSELFPSKIKELLSYSPIPVSILINNAIEVYVETEERVIPLSLLPAGVIFGLWETLDPRSSLFVERLWQISSGARTIFFLPKISDAINHRRIQTEFKICSGAPKNLIEQGDVFREIVHSEASNCQWQSSLLILTKNWFTPENQKNKKWGDFNHFLLNIAWNQSSHWRSKMYFEIIWEVFSIAIVKRNLHPTQNQINAIKHLIGIGMGIFPGFRPAVDNSAAPINYIQKVYQDIYVIKDYAPILMQPWWFLSPDITENVYYSLNFPTQLEYIVKDVRSTIDELRAIMRLNDTLMRRVKSEERRIFKMMQALQFDYYHSEPDSLNQIKDTAEIFKNDKAFNNLLKNFNNKSIPEFSSFFRGSIGISNLWNN